MNIKELARVLKSIAIVTADSSRLDELLIAEDLVCRSRFEALRGTIAPDAAARALWKSKPTMSSKDIDYDALRALPDGTLGRAYVAFLDEHDLNPDLLAAPVLTLKDPEVRYLHERYRQTHDLWHALLGLGTEGYEEVLVHAFTWAQLGLPYSALILLFGTVKHVVFEGRWDVLTKTLRATYEAGKRADFLLLVPWEEHWERPLSDVRAQFSIRAVAP